MSASSGHSFISFSLLGSASQHLLDLSDVSSGVIMFLILFELIALGYERQGSEFQKRDENCSVWMNFKKGCTPERRGECSEQS